VNDPGAEILAGRYRLEERIGIGAMGEVWRAHDLTLQREVALKRVRLDGHVDSAAQARFRREAVAMAGVSHPNVVIVYDAGTDAGPEGETAYLVMELLDGPSCADLIGADRTLPLSEVERIGAGVAAGLAAAHRAGVVHRDIKPGNIVINRGVPTIVDFGIARLEQESTATLTAPQTTIGTAAYMSPEQALGQPVGPASDIYSLGALIVALATGSPPFGATNALALMRAHVDDPPPALTDLRPEVAAALADLVTRMLAKDPEDRPSAAEAAQILAGDESVDPAGITPTAVLPATGPTDPTVPLSAPVRVADPPMAPEQDRPQRGWLWVLLVAVLLLAAVVLALQERSVSPGGAPATDPPSSPVESPTTDGVTTPTIEATTDPTTLPPEMTLSPSPEPTKRRSEPRPTASTEGPGPTLRDAVDAVAAKISAVEDDDAREDLEKAWNRLSRNLEESNLRDKIQQVRATVDELFLDGDLTAEEQRALIAAIQQLLGRLPAQ